MKLSAGSPKVSANRRRFFIKRGIPIGLLVTPLQTHSSRVFNYGADRTEGVIISADGLISKLRNVVLTVSVADCFPVYFFDPKTATVGLAHCGWRGIEKKLPAKVASRITANQSDLLVGIGPGIQSCHFEVQSDLLEKFSDYPEAILKRGHKSFIDLSKIIRSQLLALGLKPENIENFGECTYCQKDKYFSFRRDKPVVTRTVVAYIGLGL